MILINLIFLILCFAIAFNDKCFNLAIKAISEFFILLSFIFMKINMACLDSYFYNLSVTFTYLSVYSYYAALVLIDKVSI